MKRKFLLAIIPALLVLSSCGVKPASKASPILEDNLAHEEVFGDEIEEVRQLQVKKADRSTPLQPKIGVQYKIDGDNISLRYVAAISSLDVKANWYRGLAKQDSNCPLKIYDNGAYQVKESTTAYKAVGAGDGNIITPPSVGEGYQYFVVYTLRNINYETYKYSYLGAYLELTDDEGTVLTTSEVVVSCIDCQNYFSFAKDDFDGYFIEGTIGGQPKQFREINDTPDSGHHAKESGLVFNANDNFGLFKWNAQEFVYYGRFNFGGHDSFYLTDSSDVSTNYSKVLVAGTYTMKVDGNNMYELVAEHVVVDIHLATGTWEDPSKSDVERYSIYRIKDETWVSMSAITDQKYYHCEIDIGDYPAFILCRMNGATTENNWDNKWNQTNNIIFRDYAGSVLNNKITITGWNATDYSFGQA